VVLVEPVYEINIGQVARTMKNFGFRELVMVNPLVPIDKSAAVFASHARDILDNARLVDSLDLALKGVELRVATTALAAKSPHNLTRGSIPVSELAERIAEHPRTTAIIFGRDPTGLTNSEISKCDMVVTIPAHPDYPTLNISHAAAIILYELYKVRTAGGNEAKFDRESIRLLSSYFAGVLDRLGLPSHRARLTLETFERVMSRGLVAKRELTLLIGAFRRIRNEIADERLNKRRIGYATKDEGPQLQDPPWPTLHATRIHSRLASVEDL